MPKNSVITGASSGFGALTARALADAGHTVYAGMRDVSGTDAPAVVELGSRWSRGSPDRTSGAVLSGDIRPLGN